MSAHLVVRLREHLFALEGASVGEVASLPALEPLAETPSHVLGLLNLRGTLVPVVDLALRMGYERTRPDLRQAVVILERGDDVTGLLVDAVEEFADIDEASVQPAPRAPPGVVRAPDVITKRIALVDDRHVILLDLDDVLFRPRTEDQRRPGGELSHVAFDAPAEALEVFRARAQRLREPIERLDESDARPFVITRIAGETFAIAATNVVEFVRLDDLAPVPWTPPHIAGHASLRGDIIVVLDMSGLLGLESVRGQRMRAMLVRSPTGSPFGILVDDVLDVAEASQVDALPEASHAGGFVRGAFRHGESRIPILDVEGILDAPQILVKEET